NADLREHRLTRRSRRSDQPERLRLLLLLGALLLREHVAGAEDEKVLTVDRDLGAAVLRVHDGVADREVDRDELATILGAASGADREDFALLGLLLRGVGNDEAAVGRLLGLGRTDDDSVLQRLQVHRCASICAGIWSPLL